MIRDEYENDFGADSIYQQRLGRILRILGLLKILSEVIRYVKVRRRKAVYRPGDDVG